MVSDWKGETQIRPWRKDSLNSDTVRLLCGSCLLGSVFACRLVSAEITSYLQSPYLGAEEEWRGRSEGGVVVLLRSVWAREEKTQIHREPGLWVLLLKEHLICVIISQSKPLVFFSYGVGENRADSFGFHQRPAQYNWSNSAWAPKFFRLILNSQNDES